MSEQALQRPGLRSFVVMVGAEAKMVARDTAGLVVPLGLPLLILVTSAAAAEDIEIVAGVTALDLFVVPLVIVTVIAMVGIINTPSFLAYYRRTGILRRLAVTPASPVAVLVAQVVVNVLLALVGIGLALGVATAVFGLNAPAHPWVAIAIGALTMLAMYSIGMIVAAVSPTPNASVAIGLVIFFALAALGGLFGGRGALPEPLAAVGGILPFGAAIDALGAAWAGHPIQLGWIISLGVSSIVGGVIAAVFFRWE